MSVTSNSDFAVETVVDLLQGEDAATWTNAQPTIQQAQDIPFQERGPGQGQPAQLYVWSPADTSLEAFDAEYSRVDQVDTVEVQAWTLDNTETARYIEDIVDILSQYGNDNQENTNFQRIRPVSASDNRAAKVARRTDHFVGLVQVDLQNLRTTGT